MAISDIIRLGDKVDISLAQKIANKDKNEEAPQIYRSQVLDIRKNGNLQIAMPTEKGKMILLPVGVRFEFVFYSYTGSLYKSIGQVVERYRKEGFYMLEIQLRTPLERYQRREYYRHSCTTDFGFYLLNEEQMKMEAADDVFDNLTEQDDRILPCQGIMVDLSGGGMKFRSQYQLKVGEKILINLRLVNETMNRSYKVLGYVISCIEVQTPLKALYETRVRFIIEDNKIREEVIRYIFEEERRIRRKENG